MGASQTSLTDCVAFYEAGEAVHTADFIENVPVVVRDDGTVSLGPPGETRAVRAHPDGGILAACCNATSLVTGGDDGLVVRTSADGACETLHDAKGKWIDALASRDDGALAWSCGKTVAARDPKGLVKTIDVPSTARGLAFAPKGYRLAIAHYNGASLWFPNTEQAPELLEWKGSHLDATFSPDGRFVVTSMQENAMHGWRLSDRANMRMRGYPAKVRSWAWSPDGTLLATSGADSCVVWPFRDKDGPMKKAPREFAARRARVSRVAFSPKTPLLAVGFEDGWVLVSRVTDEAEILVRRPDTERHAVTGLAWSADGVSLVFGTAGGEAGLLSVPRA